MKANALYYGDNLVWLKNHDHFPDKSVDLIYLDPPFNSNADYNVIFKEKSGEQSQAQLLAFDDTWRWDNEASATALRELSNDAPEIAQLISLLGNKGNKASTSMAAYLGMMATRLLELHRVLKPTGSIYLHCDPTASHYLKIIMDSIFGNDNYVNEIIWKRATTVKSNVGQGSKRFDPNTDTILFYRKTPSYTYNPTFKEYAEESLTNLYKYTELDTGRCYRLINMTAPGGEAKGKPRYEVMGVRRYWKYTKQKMQELIDSGLVVQERTGLAPQRKLYLDEDKGISTQSLWDDIPPLSSQAKERLGYPTQKPMALLQRIIGASSKEGEIILDPFGGCGTAIIAANKLNRKWIGIDTTHLAIYLIEQRLKDSFGESIKNTYQVYGNPKDLSSAQALWNTNKKEFEIWALSLVGAKPRPYDGGVDGIMGFMETGNKPQKIVVQVKGGTSLVPSMIRDLIGTVEKEGAAMGLLISLHKPTLGMITDSVHAGSYQSELWRKEFLKIQIRTVFELLEGKSFDIPQTYSLLKKATRVRGQGVTSPLL